jgi:predicted secreted protein
MATTGIINGTNLRIYLNTGSGLTAVAYATSCSLDMSRDLRESVTKDSTGGGQTGWRTIRPGQKSGSLSAEGLLAFSADSNTNLKPMTSLFSAFSAGTSITWRFTTDTSGNDFLSGSCYITGLSLNAGAEEDSTYSFNAEVDGTIYSGTQA